MRPVFLSRNLEVLGSPRIVGKNHLRFKVRQAGTVFDAIAFGMGERLNEVYGRRDLQLVYTVEENDWTPNGEPRQGETTAQLKIKDLR
jgi:single-stranded-DNA-specific exonuclease